MKWTRPNTALALTLLLIVAGTALGQASENLTGFLPTGSEVAGMTLNDTPQNYQGEDLYQMIDGGADIYHEYGFLHALSAEYVDGRGKIIKLEMYEMTNPIAAYGIYSFKIGEGGKDLAIGQGARLEEYYLNFWQGNLQMTLIGQDGEEPTVQSVVALAKAVAVLIPQTGERPELASLLLREPLSFAQAKYLRGPIALMNNYLFDREDIFRVRDGFIGSVEGCRAMVFRYTSEQESAEVFANATNKLSASTRFSKQTGRGNQYTLLDRKQESVMLQQTGSHIAIAIGPDGERIKVLLESLVKKLRDA